MATSIEVDFDVYKELTRRRASESVTPNDVLREVLGLGPRLTPSEPDPRKGATFKGVFFPEGTDFRAKYKGKVYLAEIRNGMFYRPDLRRVHTSPSQAAVAITGKNWNGWRFWEAKFPGKDAWTLIDKLRLDNFLV